MLPKEHKKLIRRALKEHSRIFPPAHKRSLKECFTRHNGKIVFWFNTEDRTTHALIGDDL